jgi:hypothetical protein
LRELKEIKANQGKSGRIQKCESFQASAYGTERVTEWAVFSYISVNFRFVFLESSIGQIGRMGLMGLESRSVAPSSTSLNEEIGVNQAKSK